MDMPPPKVKSKREGLYIHPKEAITKQTKISCASCIAGHRSGACDHFDRILLQIRAAGRPSTVCHHQASCKGSCLQQKAFIVTNETPEWCDEHRSCIANWEYSERCPPYPVSSTKSTKRKERPSSPAVTSSDVPHNKVENTPSAGYAFQQSATLSSCCAAESSKESRLSSITSPAPIFVAAEPTMAKMSSQPSISTSNNSHLQYLHPISDTVDRHTPSGLPPKTDTFPLLQPSIIEASSGSYLNPLLETTSGIGSSESWRPLSDDFTFTFHFAPLNETQAQPNPFALAPNTIHPSLTHNPTAVSPLQQRTNIRQTQQQQTHPCPGNGFQCPCDENCRCDDCYTHGRGFWTLPFTIGDMPDVSDEQPPPTQFFMPAVSEAGTHTSVYSHAKPETAKQEINSDEVGYENGSFRSLHGRSLDVYDDWLI